MPDTQSKIDKDNERFYTYIKALGEQNGLTPFYNANALMDKFDLCPSEAAEVLFHYFKRKGSKIKII